MTDGTQNVQLPAELCEKAKQKFGGRFEDLSHMLAFVLQQLVNEDTLRKDEEEQRIIEQRLKDLGYV